jgi:hypothetical protein
MGAAQSVMGVKGAKAATSKANEASGQIGKEGGGDMLKGKTFSEASTSHMMKSNIHSGALGQLGAGAASVVGASSQFAGTFLQGEMKELEANQATMRAMREAIRSLDESLRALIQKALAAQQEITASTNQARTRILA